MPPSHWCRNRHQITLHNPPEMAPHIANVKTEPLSWCLSICLGSQASLHFALDDGPDQCRSTTRDSYIAVSLLRPAMPLFSSKFAFKKSPSRRISWNVKIHENESESEVEEDEDTSNDNSLRVKSKGKTQNTKRTKPTNELKNQDRTFKSAKSKKNVIKGKHQLDQKRGEMFINFDKSQSFKFDLDKGCWKEVKTRENEINKVLNVSQVSTGNNMKEIEELKIRTRDLEEENRLLKLKIEILMEMVTETTAELNLKDKHSTVSF